MKFDGRVVLITGAGKGIGRAYAEYFASQGASVVVNNRVHPDRVSAAEAVAEAIRAKGGKAVADGNAVENEDSAAAMVETAYKHFGRLDAMVLNAGVSIRKPFLEHSAQDMADTMNINLFGAIWPLRAALPRMREADFGRVVLTTSASGLFGQKDLALYGASKTALIGLARSIAVETRDWNFRINIISPYARTDMAKAIDPKFSDLLHPSKIAPVVGWLCEEDCKEHGAVLVAGSGRVRRTRIVESAIASATGDAPWDIINSMDGIYEPTSSVASALFMTPEIKGGKAPV